MPPFRHSEFLFTLPIQILLYTIAVIFKRGFLHMKDKKGRLFSPTPSCHIPFMIRFYHAFSCTFPAAFLLLAIRQISPASYVPVHLLCRYRLYAVSRNRLSLCTVCRRRRRFPVRCLCGIRFRRRRSHGRHTVSVYRVICAVHIYRHISL